MFSVLSSVLVRPGLYERTPDQLWTDPHIATQMLAAHLDPSTDAASRRPEFISACADWVAQLAASHADLLDIGCGPGLYTAQFARRGLKVTGLDFSPVAIDYARTHDPASTYWLGDYLALDAHESFDIITLIYYDFGALVPAERHMLLERVHRALRPGGWFILDVMTPHSAPNHPEGTAWDWCPNGGFFSPRPYLCLTGTYGFGDVGYGTRHVIVEDGSVRCYTLWDCFFTPDTLAAEAAPHGFTVQGVYADATGTPFAPESPSMAVILKR